MAERSLEATTADSYSSLLVEIIMYVVKLKKNNKVKRASRVVSSTSTLLYSTSVLGLVHQ